jgi:dTDP-4-amino-4,6-dideoxygalactose transaminase
VFADIDPVSGALTAETVQAVLTDATAAVIPVHVGGWPVDMDPLMTLAEKSGFVVIEDCAQAQGARYHGRPAGSLGHAAAFSFCQDKIISAGEGGLLATDDEAAYIRAWEYKDHGKSLAKLTDPEFMSAGSGFKWIHDGFGSNWRLPEVQAAMIRVQMGALDEWHAGRTRNATTLAGALTDVPGLSVPLPPEGFESAFYRLYGSVDTGALAPGWDRDRIIGAVLAEGVPCQYGVCAEIYREVAFERAGLQPPERLPGASHAHETSIAFLVHPTMSESDMLDTAAAVRKVMAVAVR